MPGRFPHAPDPHTGYVLMQPRSDHAPAETSGRFHPDPRIQPIHSNSQQRPVHSNLRIQPVSPPSLRQRPVQQTYAPDQLTQIPCAGEGGMDMASLRDATTLRRLRRRRQGGGCPAFSARLKAVPRTAARLEAGRDLRVFSRCVPCSRIRLRWRFRIFLPPAVQGGSVGIRPGGNLGAGARMGRMAAAAGTVPARISNMKRILEHGRWLQVRERSAPCAGTR